MKIIDAFWEKRNIGLDTVEFELESKDSINDIYESLIVGEKEYNVVKFPAGRVDISFLLAKLGYVYIENNIHLVHDLKAIQMTSLQQRIANSVDYQIMNEADLEILFFEIGKGMFKTDRIALDPRFSIEKSNSRYINWLKDELKRGAEVYKLSYDSNTIGFFALKEVKEQVYFPFLAGMYSEFESSGFGITGWVKPLQEVIKRNAKYMVNSVSSNNKTSLSFNLALGYRIDEIKNVFVKVKGE